MFTNLSGWLTQAGSHTYTVCKECLTDAIKSTEKEKTVLDHAQPYGTGGWLAVFIGECFLYPLNALVIFILIYMESVPLYRTDNLILYLPALTVLSYLSLKAGWSLRKIRSEALARVKSFLFLNVLWVVTIAAVSDNPGYGNRSVAFYYHNNALWVLFNSVLWYSYFMLSRRVKNTYPL